MRDFLWVFAGGGFGSLIRYALTVFLPTDPFPLSTWVANVLGSFLIGWFYSHYANTDLGQSPLFVFLTVGFCGGFTTFSTFSKEVFYMIQQQQVGTALFYMFISLFFCLGATTLGFYLGRS